MSERIKATKVGQKYIRVVNENLFKKVYILIIQKETFEAVYNFLERETVDEK